MNKINRMKKKITYKAFNDDFSCLKKKYVIGKSYSEKNISICNKGFHSCEFPLDVLNYYDLFDKDSNLIRFAKVEISGKQITENDKVCSENIKILEEISFETINNDSINLLLKDLVNTKTTNKDSAKIGSSGDYAVVSAIGINSRINAKKGSWITLAEYDDDNKPICVKSAKIDGKKLKEDVWYILKNKKFVELK